MQKLVTAATEAVAQRRFEEATESWTAAVDAAELPAHAPLTAVLHSERANSLLRSQKYEVTRYAQFSRFRRREVDETASYRNLLGFERPR